MPEPARGLIAALAELSPRQRSALILHYYAGYSTREVAPARANAIGRCELLLVPA
jgi:DNA-directed RNA polymerase specialized sigma24 family protein